MIGETVTRAVVFSSKFYRLRLDKKSRRTAVMDVESRRLSEILTA